MRKLDPERFHYSFVRRRKNINIKTQCSKFRPIVNMTPNYLGPARLCQSARSTTDIRDQHRQSLQTQRYETRFARMLKKRGLVSEIDDDNSETYSDSSQDRFVHNKMDVWGSALDISQDISVRSHVDVWDSIIDTDSSLEKDEFNSDPEASEMSGSYDEVDVDGSDSWDPSSWFSDVGHHQQRPCNTPSPSLSIGSESSYNSLTGSPIPLSKRNRPPRSRHESLLLRKRVTETCKDDEIVRGQYEELKAFIILNCSKPELLIHALTTRWRTISNAILHQDNELKNDALNLTNDLVSSRWIKTEDLLFILQQGFLLTLGESLVRSGNHQTKVIKILLAIIRHGPGSTPYIIQISSNFGLLETFSELFLMGSFEDTRMVAQFYSEVFQVLCDLAASDEFAPIVPASIAASSSDRKLKELYDPIQTLKRLVQPNLTAPIINWLFKQIGFIECQTFRSSLALVANFIRFVTFYLQNVSSDTEWARSMTETFEYGHIESLIRGSIEIGSIDQYPGSVKVELEQFLDFYRCWSDEITHLFNC